MVATAQRRALAAKQGKTEDQLIVRTTLHLYCEESRHLPHDRGPFLLRGLAACPAEKAHALNADLTALWEAETRKKERRSRSETGPVCAGLDMKCLCGMVLPQNKNMFGEFIKKLRAERRLGLREFCIAASCDPSNWSKIERGLLPPPQDGEILERIAVILGLSAGSEERNSMSDYAAIDAGKIPPYVLEDAELLKRLPVFFRTATGKKPKPKELARLAEILKHSEGQE